MNFTILSTRGGNCTLSADVETYGELTECEDFSLSLVDMKSTLLSVDGNSVNQILGEDTLLPEGSIYLIQLSPYKHDGA